MGRGSRQPPASASDPLGLRVPARGLPAWLPQRKDTTTVGSANGVTFTVRIVRPGDRYGRDDCLVHEGDEPLVEFYDASQDPAVFGPRGQFVSRYAISAITSHGPNALDLNVEVPLWKLSAEAMAAVQRFLDEQRHV